MIHLLIIFTVAVVSPKIIIYEPHSLKQLFESTNYEIDHVNANYGHIPYGQSIIGNLHFSKNNSLGCNKTLSFDAQREHNSEEGPIQPIFMVYRGSCTFVTKSRNIARAGGSVAMIIDNKSDTSKDLIMSDDGTGAGIRIPGVLIGKEHGQKLLDYMNTASEEDLSRIKVGIQFVMPKRDISKVQIWYSSSDDRSLDFIRNMGNYLKDILKNIDFEPNFVTWPCQGCDKEFRTKNCLGDGKYCALQHDKQIWHTGEVERKTSLSGRDIIMENLRQFCLYKKLGEENRQHEFFDYIKAVHEICSSRITHDCHLLGIKKLNFNETVISKCVNKSFFHQKKDNVYLKQMFEQWQEYGTNTYPSVTINNLSFRGQINPDNVFEAICASFLTTPYGCRKWLEAEGIQMKARGGVSNKGLAVIVGVLMLVNVVIIYFYRKNLKSELRQEMAVQVNSAVSQYVAINMSEGEDNK